MNALSQQRSVQIAVVQTLLDYVLQDLKSTVRISLYHPLSSSLEKIILPNNLG
jgi:hypothetical protein